MAKKLKKYFPLRDDHDNTKDYFDLFFQCWIIPEFLEGEIKEKESFSFGTCQNETCSHNEHDPYQEGISFYLCVKELDSYAKRNKQVTKYKTEGGIIFIHEILDNGIHFAEDYNYYRLI